MDKVRHDPRRVAWLVSILILCFAASIMEQGYAQNKRQKSTLPKKESYTRPAPTRPIKPEIPAANRYRDDKVFLEQADSLYTVPVFGQHTRQIVKGNVIFRQGGTWMYCDSAYYYPDYNSMDAFGHVRMEQGDTLFVYADKLFYNGNERRARLRCGPSQPIVRLKNRNTVLTTDSLDYNLLTELGECNYGLKIDDQVNVLTALVGRYSANTKDADFFHDVVLVNNKDGFRMLTDTLYYNTGTHIASIVTPTVIEGENDTIHTSRGWYNTESGVAELTSRSLIVHRDSVGRATTLEGDSLIYDKKSRLTRAYSFRAPWQQPRPMVLTDTANKMILYGGFGWYNDSTREALATEYPLLVEHSRPDTLFLRADTINTFMEVRRIMPPVTPAELAARDSLVRADSIAQADYRAALAAITPESTEMRPEPPVVHVWQRDSSLLFDKEFHIARAFRNGRFFNQEIQGVADSLVYLEADSLLHMYYKPVIWSDNRQVYGNKIVVHLNDSTADWAQLPEYGMMAEYVDEDFYNQLTGKEMMAYFENKALKRLEAEGNVMTIFLPQEQDSTYNKLVNVESAYLTLDMTDQKMDKLKMWPEVQGEVIPLFKVKPSQTKLNGFVWLEAIRPKREWYGDHWVWIDDLGEVPDELIQYFSEPPMQFGRR